MNPPAALRQITLIGAGLISGSFVLDLKRLGLVEKVAGIDLSHSNPDHAPERGAIDEALDTVGENNIVAADLVLIAIPVPTLSAIYHGIAPFPKAGALVSDVGSTKQSALEAFCDCLPGRFPYCIAAYPIVGSDRNGVLVTQFDLYQGKKPIITPYGQEDSDGLYKPESLWQTVGTETYRMNIAKHDAILAVVSHMPHLLTFALIHQILGYPTGQTYLKFVATGFCDFTHIVSSHSAIWTGICMANKNSLLDLIGGLHTQLGVLKGILEIGDRPALHRYLEEVKQTHGDWQANQPL